MADDERADHDAVERLFERLKSSPNRYRIGESPGVEADLRLYDACRRAVAGEPLDRVLRALRGD